jgi:hypothetical protein
MDNRLLAKIIRKGGGKLLDLAAGRLVSAKASSDGEAKSKGGLKKAIAGAAITRIATRSVPGAIMVGGGILAKALYDRRRAKRGKDGDGRA